MERSTQSVFSRCLISLRQWRKNIIPNFSFTIPLYNIFSIKGTCSDIFHKIYISQILPFGFMAMDSRPWAGFRFSAFMPILMYTVSQKTIAPLCSICGNAGIDSALRSSILSYAELNEQEREQKSFW